MSILLFLSLDRVQGNEQDQINEEMKVDLSTKGGAHY